MHAAHYRHLLLLPLALLIAIASLLAVRTSGIEPPSERLVDDSPEACITRLLSAEVHGDVGAYLDCFSQAEHSRLGAKWQSYSQSQIASEVLGYSSDLVGKAITNLNYEGADRAGLTIERIKVDRVGHQEARLIREHGWWQVATLSAVNWRRPSIPYGTPVSPLTSVESVSH